LLINLIGEDRLGSVLMSGSLLQPILAAVIGLIRTAPPLS
jgi:hypothetical protein